MSDFLKKYWLLLILSLFKIAISVFLLNSNYELHRDELLYADQGSHLAWGYLEVPPMMAAMSYCSKALLGGNFAWGLKAWMELCGGLTVFATGLIVMRMGGGLFAQALACWGVMLSAYLRVHILFQANALDILCWTMICYYMVCYFKKPENRFLLYCGVFVGFGVLSKYSIGFYVAALFIGALLTDHRKLLTNKYTYFAALIALAICSPNLWWQYSHRFPLFHHFNELYELELQHITPTGFLVAQLFFLLPAIIIWTSGLIFALFSREGVPYRMLGIAFLSVIAILVILHGKHYYSLGAYPVLMAFGGYYLEKQTRGDWKLWMRPALFIIPVLLYLPFSFLGVPSLEPDKMAEICQKYKILGILLWEDGKDHPLPQDYADMLGWQEMTAKVAKVYQNLSDEDKKRVYIHCDNYGEAGALNFYGKKYNLPEAHSFNSSYILWTPDRARLSRVIMVTQQKTDPVQFSHFRKEVVCDSVVNPLARELGARILYMTDADSALTVEFNLEIAKRKSLFVRAEPKKNMLF